MFRKCLFVLVWLTLSRFGITEEQEKDPFRYQNFLKSQVGEWRKEDRPPKTLEEWKERKERLREMLIDAWGGFPENPVPLDPKILGTMDRADYRVEKVVFQTMPQVWMTANAYVPKNAEPRSLPAVLCVHGHWSGAKQDPVVQSRCIGLAKLGYFVLCCDAFGAGERAIEKKLGEYHGEMTGALLFPAGRPLSGIQVYENTRAIDYLQSRSEVDPNRIGVTGASGGGNQSMYIGAIDERLKCVVPTCSVGTYHSYLSAACCMCEVVPGGMRFTEEGDILGLSADRGLMVTSATKDAFQFSVEQAAISVGRADGIAQFFKRRVKHTIIESPHHYNQPMREAMYGWMDLHLKGTGDGSPIPEPSIATEEPEALRCYPAASRPDDYLTLPQFAFRESQLVLKNRSMNEDAETLMIFRSKESSLDRKQSLQSNLRSQFASLLRYEKPTIALEIAESTDSVSKIRKLEWTSEQGIRLAAYSQSLTQEARPKTVILLDLDRDPLTCLSDPVAEELRQEGWRTIAPELRAVGRFAYPKDKIGNAIDHNSAEWGLWVGRPLVGQWAIDLSRCIDAYTAHDGQLPHRLTVYGRGSAGNCAVIAASLDPRIEHAVSERALISLVSDVPYRGVRLGIIIPDCLERIGNVAHMAALAAPRKISWIGGVNGGGEAIDASRWNQEFSYAKSVFTAFGCADHLQFVPDTKLTELLDSK